MRPRSAALVVGAAVVLGGVTGAYVLPTGGSGRLGVPAAAPTPSASSVSPTASPTAAPSPTPTTPSTPATSSTPSTKATNAPSRPTEADLLSVRSFADESVTVTYTSKRGSTDPGSAVSACVDDDAHEGHRTLAEVTGHDPVLEGLWGEDATDDTANQVVAVADDAADATGAVTRLVEAQAGCQRATKGQWVYGPARTTNRSSTLSWTWIGYFPGEQNTTGRAPSGVEPCGGLVLARNGARFSVVYVYMCLDQVQLDGLGLAAATRLD